MVGTTPRRPGPVVLNDRRTSHVPSISGSTYGSCMVWKGGGADRRSWFSVLDQPLPSPLPGGVGHTWGPQAPAALFETASFPTFDEVLTDDGVAVTENPHNGQLVMAWRGRGDDARISWAVFDGESWEQRGAVPGALTSKPPTLACDGTVVHLAWRNTGDDYLSWTRQLGSTWWRPTVLDSLA